MFRNFILYNDSEYVEHNVAMPLLSSVSLVY